MGLSLHCPHCRRPIGNTNRVGEIWLRVRSLVIRKNGDHRYVCPKCRGLLTGADIAPSGPSEESPAVHITDETDVTLS